MSSTPQIRLLRVLARASWMYHYTGTVGDVEYRREGGEPNGIYVTLELSSRWSRFHYLGRSNEQVKVTALQLPFSRRVAIEFCGKDIDDLLVAVSRARENDALTVSVLAPLLTQLQNNFSVS